MARKFAAFWIGAGMLAGAASPTLASGSQVTSPIALSRSAEAPANVGGPIARRLPLGSAQDFSWNPQLAENGPVSIIVSTGDQQVVILRAGIEIGRARAVIRQQALSSQVLTMTRGANGASQWIQVGVSAIKPEGGEVISTRSGEATSTRGVERMGLPAEFAARMKSVMTPGTTVLVTRAEVDARWTGANATMLESKGEAAFGPEGDAKPKAQGN